MNSDEIDHNNVVTSTTLDSGNLNKNVDLKNIDEINHPLSLNNKNIKNNNQENDNNSDMTEINLTNNSKNDENPTENTKIVEKKKLNWVKFDDVDENNTSNSKLNTASINYATESTTFPAISLSIANANINNNINNNVKEISITENDISTTSISKNNTKTPPPRNTNKNSPVLHSQDSNNSSTSPSAVIDGAAVLTTESFHVNLESSSIQKPNVTSSPTKSTPSTSNTVQQINNVSITIPSTSSMRTIELSTGRVREGFVNGDTIVTLLPTNTKWPWITPAVFRPELVPEELMAQGLTLTVEEYVNAMETLVNDYRFTIYNVCYKRVLVCWILFAFCVLLILLFSGLQGIALFSLGVGWLFLNAAAIFLCMWIKLRLSRGLEKCLARVNKLFLRHKILVVLDDRGRLSCHKVNLSFMYFDPAQCIAHLNDFITNQEQSGNTIQAGWEKKLDIDVDDIVINGANPVRLSRKQAVAQEIFLTYLQRWGKDFLRNRLNWTINEAGVHESPRHLPSSICPCQYEEEILNNKIKIAQNSSNCCGIKNPFKGF